MEQENHNPYMFNTLQKEKLQGNTEVNSKFCRLDHLLSNTVILNLWTELGIFAQFRLSGLL